MQLEKDWKLIIKLMLILCLVQKNRLKNRLFIDANLRAARSLFPTSMHEYEIRRDYLNAGIVNCNQIINSLQRVVGRFNVDLNAYGRYSKAIDREIELIKRWRQRDNKNEIVSSRVTSVFMRVFG